MLLLYVCFYEYQSLYCTLLVSDEIVPSSTFLLFKYIVLCVCSFIVKTYKWYVMSVYKIGTFQVIIDLVKLVFPGADILFEVGTVTLLI